MGRLTEKALADLTTRQLELLCDLLALQRAGMISDEKTVLVTDGYDEGSKEAEIPATITWLGEKTADEFIKSAGVMNNGDA